MRHITIAFLALTLSLKLHAGTFLKEDTAHTVRFGPFLNASDGVTPERGITASSMEPNIKVSKNGGAFALRNSTTDPVHDDTGWYSVHLDATDTSTPGKLIVKCHDASVHKPVWMEFEVVPANVYESLVAGSVKLQSDVTHWNGTAIPGVDTAGYPKVTIKDGTGTGELDTASGKVALTTNDQWQIAVKSLAASQGYKNIWYVSTNGNDTNDGTTPATAEATLAAAKADASAGDLIVVMPGTYTTTTQLAKHQVDWYYAPGASAQQTATSLALYDSRDLSGDPAATDYNVFGHGALSTDADGGPVIAGPDTSAARITIAASSLSASSQQVATMWEGLITIHAEQVTSTANEDVFELVGGHMFVKCERGTADSSIVELGGGTFRFITGRFVTSETVFTNDITSNLSTFILEAGVLESTSASAGGLYVAEGSAAYLISGSIKVPAGRPALSGAGVFYVSDAVAYDASNTTDANIVKTPTQAMYAKLPSKDYLAGTSNSDGDVQMDEATGNFPGSVGSVAGNVVGSVGSVTGNVAGSVGSVSGNVGGSVSSVTAGVTLADDAISAAKIANNAIGATEIADSAIDAATFVMGAIDAAAMNVTGSEFSAIPWNAAWDSTLADAVWDEARNAHTDLGTFGEYTNSQITGEINTFDELTDGAPTLAEAMHDHGYTTDRAEKIDTLAPTLLVSTTIDDTITPTQTSFALTSGPPDDDALNGALVVITDATTPSQKSIGIVKDYIASSKTVTLVTDPGIFTFANGDIVDVIAGGPVPLWLGGSP